MFSKYETESRHAIEVYLEDGMVFDTSGRKLPCLVPHVNEVFHNPSDFELLVNFKASGSYDSGDMVTPPHHEEDRELVSVELEETHYGPLWADFKEGKLERHHQKIELPVATQEFLFGFYLEDVYNVEIEREV